MKNYSIRRFQGYLDQFLLGSGKWGLIRLGFALLIMFFFSYLGYQAFHRITLAEVIQSWIIREDILTMVPGIFLKSYAFISRNLRFIWIVFWALAAALFIGSAYLSGIQKDSHFAQSLQYLIQSLFSLGSSNAIIREGNLDLTESNPELLRLFGGPGSVVVEPGNVVVLEHLDKPSRLVAEGVHRLTRFEKMKELKSDFKYYGQAFPTLDERHGYLKKTSGTTKDGIELEMVDIHYRYRLRMGMGFGDYVQRSPEKPNPVSVKGVLKMVYNRTVRLNSDTKKPEVTPWHNLVNITVEGAIIDFVREHKFDSLIIPDVSRANQEGKAYQTSSFEANKSYSKRDEEGDFKVEYARDVITDRILSKNLRSRLREVGADLLWWDIGHISIRNPVVIQQLLDKWATYWDGRASIERARGEAEMVKMRELAQAEYQAEMLMSIVNSLNVALSGVDDQGRSDEEIRLLRRERVRNIILAKTTQLLEAITSGGDVP